MYQTHTPEEVASVLSLGVSGVALVAVGLAFAPADAAYFDPRPWLDRAGARLCVEIVRAKHTARAAVARARIGLVAALLVAATHLDPSPSSAPKKGAHHA